MMKLNRLGVCLLLFLGASYALPDSEPSAPLLVSPASSDPTWSSTPQELTESTRDPLPLLYPVSDGVSGTSPSLPQQDQTEPSASSQQTQGWVRPPQEKVEAVNFKFPATDMGDAGGGQAWETEAEGVAFVMMKPKGQRGEPHEAGSHAMALFLGGCSLLLCLFIGVYCIYSRGSKKEPISHHRLYEDGFDDPALFLDNPKEYDWFFYETDTCVYPKHSQNQPKPIQTLSVPALKQPPPALETSLGKMATPEATQETKPNVMTLESLSPDKLCAGNNFIWSPVPFQQNL